MASKHFTRALEAMRSGDPRVREDGFDFLREHADAYVDELIAAFAAERDGPDGPDGPEGPEGPDGHDERDGDGLRCWLLELISEARSPQALPMLAEQLDSEDESLRFWAIRGLEMLDSREAHQELSRARSSGWIS